MTEMSDFESGTGLWNGEGLWDGQLKCRVLGGEVLFRASNKEALKISDRRFFLFGLFGWVRGILMVLY
jgi:hypothetical protein